MNSRQGVSTVTAGSTLEEKKPSEFPMGKFVIRDDKLYTKYEICKTTHVTCSNERGVNTPGGKMYGKENRLKCTGTKTRLSNSPCS